MRHHKETAELLHLSAISFTPRARMTGVCGLRDGKIKVLYIAGYERSGSTLLHNVLGQLDGFFAAGELNEIWDRGLIENRRCGCGAPFKECEVWREILTNGFGGVESIRAREISRVRDSVRNRHFPLALLPRNERFLESRLCSFPQHLARLYGAIRSTTGSRVIVDSSKSPMYGYVLGGLPEIELYVVHLVRDPRSVLYSQLKRKAEQHDGYLKHNSVKGSLAWNTLNLVTETILRAPHRYIRLRFEDFVREPREIVERILEMTREKAERFPFTGIRTVELTPTHSRGGSPSRFDTGTVDLRVDETWKQKMKPSDKVMVTALTWPLLSRYGYSDNQRSGGS